MSATVDQEARNAIAALQVEFNKLKGDVEWHRNSDMAHNVDSIWAHPEDGASHRHSDIPHMDPEQVKDVVRGMPELAGVA